MFSQASFQGGPNFFIQCCQERIIRGSSNDESQKKKNVHKNNELASFQTLSRLFGHALFVKCRPFSLEVNSYRLYPGSKRERKIRPRMFTSSIKR